MANTVRFGFGGTVESSCWLREDTSGRGWEQADRGQLSPTCFFAVVGWGGVWGEVEVASEPKPGSGWPAFEKEKIVEAVISARHFGVWRC
jgi:hypothetical protein